MKKTKLLYKFLREGLKSDIGNLTWEIGKWVHQKGKLDICHNGLHCSETPYQAFSYIQGEILALVETKGEAIIADDKQCWSDMRIIKAYKWQKKDSVAFSIYAAELVLDNYEKIYPTDDRPRKAIEAAKKVLFENTQENRSVANSAAHSAYSAAHSANSAALSAHSATYLAARSAYSAARSADSAARSAARSAYSAEYSASSAAYSADSAARSAYSAADSAANSAARSAMYKKFGNWMVKHIKQLEEIV
jgi:hypothetical protein